MKGKISQAPRWQTHFRDSEFVSSALQEALALGGKRKVGEIAIDDISVDASRMTTMSESNATLHLLQDATSDTASL